MPRAVELGQRCLKIAQQAQHHWISCLEFMADLQKALTQPLKH